MCVPDPASDGSLSASDRAPCYERVSDVKVSFKTLPTLRPEIRQWVGASRAELGTSKLLFSPHTRGSSQRFADTRRHDSSTKDTHFPGPSSVSITTSFPCLFGGSCGSDFFFFFFHFFAGEPRRKSRKAATT